MFSQCCLGLPQICSPLSSASLIGLVIGVHHHAQLLLFSSYSVGQAGLELRDLPAFVSKCCG